MRKRKQSIVALIIMTMLLSIFQVIPVWASGPREGLQIGEYVKLGTYQGEDIIWRVESKDTLYGTLLVLVDDLESDSKKGMEGLENSLFIIDKISESDNDSMQWRRRNAVNSNQMYSAIYIQESQIIFKLGEGTEQEPYTLYTEWKGVPSIVAEKDKIVLSGVELIGQKPLQEIHFIVQVDNMPVVISQIEEDTINKTITLKLAQPIKEGQTVVLKYDLSSDAFSAFAKAGEKLVLVQIPPMMIENKTVDQVIPKETIITEALVGGEFKVGDTKELRVSALGEGEITFNWYKNDQLVYTEKKLSAGVSVCSIYPVGPMTLADAGTYKVIVSGLGGQKTTQCEIKVKANQYTITTASNPVRGGTVTDNSIGQNGVYNENDMVTVTAKPRSDYRFISWSENGKVVSTDRSYTFKVTGNRNLIANFRYDEPYVPQYTIYVKEYPSEGGTVTGDYTYNEGDYATLKAKAKEGYIFESWIENGKVVSRSSEYSFTVKENRWLEANFEEETKSFKEEWNALSYREQKAIKENFEEYLPYTTINQNFSTSELDDLTNNKFTNEQLREVVRNTRLLKDIGVVLDWEVITLKEVSRPSFVDMSRSHWAYDNIIELAKRGIVTGYPDQSFKPSKELTVSDTFTFLDRVLLLNDVTQTKLPKSTVEQYIYNKNSWAFNHTASIGSKLSKDTLKTIEVLGDKPLSRELLAQVLYEVTNGELKQTDRLVTFTDTRYSPYQKAIDYCITRGLLRGTSSNTMSPLKPVTRAEIMTILQRLDNAL